MGQGDVRRRPREFARLLCPSSLDERLLLEEHITRSSRISWTTWIQDDATRPRESAKSEGHPETAKGQQGRARGARSYPVSLAQEVTRSGFATRLADRQQAIATSASSAQPRPFWPTPGNRTTEAARPAAKLAAPTAAASPVAERVLGDDMPPQSAVAAVRRDRPRPVWPGGCLRRTSPKRPGSTAPTSA